MRTIHCFSEVVFNLFRAESWLSPPVTTCPLVEEEEKE